jgi:hypothetical protein
MAKVAKVAFSPVSSRGDELADVGIETGTDVIIKKLGHLRAHLEHWR